MQSKPEESRRTVSEVPLSTGDIAQLRSGGPLMTIFGGTTESVRAAWFARDDSLQVHDYPRACVLRVRVGQMSDYTDSQWLRFRNVPMVRWDHISDPTPWPSVPRTAPRADQPVSAPDVRDPAVEKS